MKRSILIVSAAVLAAFIAIQAETLSKNQAENAEQEIIELEKHWGAAEVSRDVAFFDRILAPEYKFTTPEGVVWTRAQYLENLKSGDLAVISSTLEEIQVDVYGDVAVCFGRATSKAQLKGKDISSQYRFTDTWIRRAGCWQCVADHSSEIAQR